MNEEAYSQLIWFGWEYTKCIHIHTCTHLPCLPAASVHASYAPHPAGSGTATFPTTSVNPSSTSSQSHTNCTLSVFPVHKTTSVLSNVKCPVYLYSFKLCNICKTILLNSLDSLKNTYIYIYIYLFSCTRS